MTITFIHLLLNQDKLFYMSTFLEKKIKIKIFHSNANFIEILSFPTKFSYSYNLLNMFNLEPTQHL